MDGVTVDKDRFSLNLANYIKLETPNCIGINNENLFSSLNSTAANKFPNIVALPGGITEICAQNILQQGYLLNNYIETNWFGKDGNPYANSHIIGGNLVFSSPTNHVIIDKDGNNINSTQILYHCNTNPNMNGAEGKKNCVDPHINSGIMNIGSYINDSINLSTDILPTPVDRSTNNTSNIEIEDNTSASRTDSDCSQPVPSLGHTKDQPMEDCLLDFCDLFISFAEHETTLNSNNNTDGFTDHNIVDMTRQDPIPQKSTISSMLSETKEVDVQANNSIDAMDVHGIGSDQCAPSYIQVAQPYTSTIPLGGYNHITNSLNNSSIEFSKVDNIDIKLGNNDNKCYFDDNNNITSPLYYNESFASDLSDPKLSNINRYSVNTIIPIEYCSTNVDNTKKPQIFIEKLKSQNGSNTTDITNENEIIIDSSIRNIFNMTITENKDDCTIKSGDKDVLAQPNRLNEIRETGVHQNEDKQDISLGNNPDNYHLIKTLSEKVNRFTYIHSFLGSRTSQKCTKIRVTEDSTIFYLLVDLIDLQINGNKQLCYFCNQLKKLHFCNQRTYSLREVNSLLSKRVKIKHPEMKRHRVDKKRRLNYGGGLKKYQPKRRSHYDGYNDMDGTIVAPKNYKKRRKEKLMEK